MVAFIVRAFIIGIMIGNSFNLFAQDPDLVFMLRANPFQQIPTKKTPEMIFADSTSEIRIILSTLISFYQSYISSQDDDSCVFTKSCSVFSREAVNKYGILMGLMMTADRLLRCHPLALKYRPMDAKTRLAIDLPVENYYLKKLEHK